MATRTAGLYNEKKCRQGWDVWAISNQLLSRKKTKEFKLRLFSKWTHSLFERFLSPGSSVTPPVLQAKPAWRVTFDSLKPANRSIVSEIKLGTKKYQRKLKEFYLLRVLASVSSYARAVQKHFYSVQVCATVWNITNRTIRHQPRDFSTTLNHH